MQTCRLLHKENDTHHEKEIHDAYEKIMRIIRLSISIKAPGQFSMDHPQGDEHLQE